MSDELIQRITFALPLHTFNLLSRLALQRGYRSASGYARALAEQAVGVVDFTPLSAPQLSLITQTEKVILESLRRGPKTMAQLVEETGKWPQNLTPVMKKLLDKSWVRELDSKYTGGRPARVFEVAEAGFLRLEQEAERRRKNDEKAAADLAAQRAESARAHPDPVPVADAPPRLRVVEIVTDEDRFTQAALDALYKAHPTATPEQVEPAIAKLCHMTKTMVAEGYSTWADEIESVTTNPFPEGAL